MTAAPIAGADGAPPEPDWRTIFTNEDDLACAAEQWSVVIRELQAAGTLAEANGHQIKRLVEFRVQYERAARHVAEKGAILAPSSKKAKVGQWNPFWSVMRQADENIRVAEVELGISPSRRSKAGKVNRVQKTARAADKFLGS